MKSKLTTHDIVVLIHELRDKLLGLRVDQVYDVDKKSYLIRLTKTNTKHVLFIESGCRFHTTSFEWPKNPAPSGFTMKLRKHLSNKRLENITQVGVDRVVDFQFGTDAFEFHIFLELYDKGNIILTDQTLSILSLVRPHVLGEDKISPHQKYATDKAKTSFSLSREEMELHLASSPGKSLREVFLSKVEFGPSLFSFVLKEEGLAVNSKIPALENTDEQKLFADKLFRCLERGRGILEGEIQNGGFISLDTKALKKATSKPLAASAPPGNPTEQPFVVYDQFHPTLLASNYDPSEIITFPTLDEAIDDFFSKIEAQKIELKQKTQERAAYGKLESMKESQKRRLDELQQVQEVDKRKAELIMFNQEIVEAGISIMRQLIANQLSWDDIWKQIKEAQKAGDELAKQIIALNLIKNQITMKLNDPYETVEADKSVTVEINLDFSAYANASKYFDLKKASAKKEERTLESAEKALKSTEKKTMSSLREVATIQSIKKVRKVFWFEKFRWFISSENYIVLGGTDAQQNELLVKRYLKPKDVYLHADSHGAPTVIIKNDSAPGPVMPKTLNEAATMAVCASHAWDEKIIPAVWWVWGDQVSKSAQTGEYLPTGSFMIRGKKNFLPPTQLVLGFGFLFRLSEESIPRHANDRSRRVHTSSVSVTTDGSIRSSISVSEGEALNEPDTTPPAVSPSDTDSDNSETNDNEEAFPDTKVEIPLNEKPGTSRTRTVSSVSANSIGDSGGSVLAEDGGEGTVISAGVVPGKTSTDMMKLKQKAKKKEKEAKKQGKVLPKNIPAPIVEPVQPSSSTGNKPKRGQHGRQKKLKEKYRFQDEEERDLRIQLLTQARPKGNEPTVLPTTLDKIEETAVDPLEIPESATKKKDKTASALKAERQATGTLEEEEQVEVPEMETNLLNTLTGAPLEEDELLFAIPVVAPYSTLQNYKFKIKMIPGTAKRGKAARNALESFLRDKNVRPREKDLLKSVKDQDLARYFPGKVKLAGGVDKK